MQKRDRVYWSSTLIEDKGRGPHPPQPPAVRMLTALKDAAWSTMNSYVHSGIHPIVQHHAGFQPEYAMQALRNSNGLAGMAATLMAIMTGDPAIATGVRDAQLAHLDCMPPLGTPPPANPPAP